MDGLELFFKALLQKGLAKKGKKGRGGKQSKKRCTVVLFVSTNDSRFVTLFLYGDPKASLL